MTKKEYRRKVLLLNMKLDILRTNVKKKVLKKDFHFLIDENKNNLKTFTTTINPFKKHKCIEDLKEVNSIIEFLGLDSFGNLIKYNRKCKV